MAFLVIRSDWGDFETTWIGPFASFCEAEAWIARDIRTFGTTPMSIETLCAPRNATTTSQRCVGNRKLLGAGDAD